MMEDQRGDMLAQSRLFHDRVEQEYLNNPAAKGDDDWQEKQRLLLADMALHLFQTALRPGGLRPDKLRNNIYAILTIADQFLPEADLATAKEKLFNNQR
ncbi:MAG: hypothetical protein COB54_02965 [Alphaproteobacteria bacterium]|nr:MAG: hypothetical protein COB54_02965 [Alphaproteobacteria bacterium]